MFESTSPEIQDNYLHQIEVNQALTDGIHSAYYINFDDDSFIIEKVTDDVRKEFKKFIDSTECLYSKTVDVYCSKFVHKDDYERMCLELNRENILSRLKKQHSFCIQYRIKENHVYDGYFEMHFVDISRNENEHKAFVTVRCIDEQKKIEIKQQKELEFYETKAKESLDIINELSGSGFWYFEYDTDGNRTNIYLSDKFRYLLGYKNEKEFPNTFDAILERIYPDDRDMIYNKIHSLTDGREEFNVIVRIMKKDGRYSWYQSSAKALRYSNGKPRLVIGTFVDISENKEREFLNALVASMSKISYCIYVMDLNNNSYIRVRSYETLERMIKNGANLEESIKVWLQHVCPETRSLLEEFLVIENMKEFFKEKDKVSFDYKGIHGWTHSSFIVVERDENGVAAKVLWMCEDISDEMNKRIQHENELNKYFLLSYTDKMTGVFNRAAFMRDIEMYEELGAENIAVIYADINGLKSTNDFYGHDAGDKLIMKSVKTLKDCFMRKEDKIYRTGGDEFVILMTNVTSEEFDEAYNNLKDKLKKKDILSVGGIWAESESDIDLLTRKAEKFMYENKNEYYLNHPELDRRKK